MTFHSSMKINDFSCKFNSPKALTTKVGEEGVIHGLPPYAPVDACLVDEYPACPSNWMNGSKKSSSYFLPIESGMGMWLDFNECSSLNHDVAIVLSIQGINPITGMKHTALNLEQYKNKCPIHNVDFHADRLCKECGYNWPAQNYISTTAARNGRLWIDGFRAPDGKVYQYLFTEDDKRGVAAQLIGEDRVFAIGVAFYKSKKEKLRDTYFSTIRHMVEKKPFIPPHSQPYWGIVDNDIHYTCNNVNTVNYSCDTVAFREEPVGRGVLRSVSNNSLSASVGEQPTSGAILSYTDQVEVKKMEIAAGAAIHQSIDEDTKDISYWNDTPDAFLYINYCDKEDFNKIINAGKRPQHEKGFLHGIKVGN